MVHFPVNILALRTVHKYERVDSFEEDDESAHAGEDAEDAEVVSMWSREYPIASEEPGEDIGKLPVEKDFDKFDSKSVGENDTVVANGLPSPDSPVEKKIRKAARRKKLEGCDQEWVAAIDTNIENHT